MNKRGAPYLYEAEALYDYDAAQAGDLGFREGDIIEVTVEVNEEWLEGRSRGNMGLFPRSYIKTLWRATLQPANWLNYSVHHLKV